MKLYTNKPCILFSYSTAIYVLIFVGYNKIKMSYGGMKANKIDIKLKCNVVETEESVNRSSNIPDQSTVSNNDEELHDNKMDIVDTKLQDKNIEGRDISQKLDSVNVEITTSENLNVDIANENVESLNKDESKTADAVVLTNTPTCVLENIHYEGDLAIYTDEKSGYQYQWDKEKNEWVHKEVYGFEDDTHTYTDSDGTKFFWDKEKRAWFPKINDDFMAQYQMSYGFVDNTKDQSERKAKPIVNKTEVIVEKSKSEELGAKRKVTEPSWFDLDESHNNKVYVTNLPKNITEEEFVDLMQKCGLIMRDSKTQKMKVKLYKEAGTDILKGDALCTYIRVESVELALNLLDGMDFKGKKIKVERAKFQMRGMYNPTLKPKAKKRKEKQKLQRIQEKLLSWQPEKTVGERSKHEKIVIIKNVFDPIVFDEDVGLILEYQNDLREECSKVGIVRKVVIYDRHPEGVAQVNMSEPEEADACVTLLSGRWFGKRMLTAEIWDGRTKFRIAETDSEITQRLNKWDEFLEGNESEVKSKQGATKEKKAAHNI